MRAFGLIGTFITLAVIAYLTMTRTGSNKKSQAAKMRELQQQHGIELPNEVLNGDLSKMPDALQKDLEKKMKSRTPDLNDK